MTVVITGATGTVGREVARRLVSAGRPVRLLARRPEGLRRLRDELLGTARAGVEAASVDLGDRQGLERAFRGARAVLVVTSDPLSPEHDARLVAAASRESTAAAHRRDAAAGGQAPDGERGAVHLVKLSALAVTDPCADDLLTRWQRENEDRIRESGLPWTLLRPRAFMSNTLAWAPGIRDERTVRAYGGRARNACVDPRDIAEAAAAALGDPAHHGLTHHLTGPEALSAAEQTEQLGRLLDTRLTLVELSRARAEAALRARWPEPVALALLASAERLRAGSKAGTEPGVARATGRPPTSFARWAADHRAAFA
ncbi:SDR family NAD(P)-dependent oxidoreductase [Streptomyces sp. XM4193]|uniref:SDR family NAD(P)-dependent oxidoreductase n=1 Tax=Streptomyces sp. XM4193 TaxID=2929782 RepID=UPI001FF8E995|nr:SDR family NAD(P)-dependent oxidoreductase [Streptomyces sp. XM4193]MCK1794597.1 SDR family NAD(P)-dependent oxidoreductase [Streptomyces sp. XM4193]